MSWTLQIFVWTLCYARYYASNGTETEQMSRLFDDLMRSYNKNIIPANAGAPVIVAHSFSLERIASFEHDILELDGTVSMSWADHRLRWDPKDFGGVSLLSLNSNLIWKPDVVLYGKSADPVAVAPDMGLNAMLQPNGDVLYVWSTKIRVYCKIPDNQRRDENVTCVMTYMSWTYNGFLLDFKNQTATTSFGIDFSSFDDTFGTPDWEIVSSSAERNVAMYACCPEPFPDKKYTIVLKRKQKSGMWYDFQDHF